MSYDALRAGWTLRCAARAVRVLVPLHRFRRIEELPGAVHPPIYRVAFRCPACRGSHDALLSASDLDVAPLEELPPAFHDLALGHMTWDGDAVSERWVQAIRRGRWPIVFDCASERRVIPGWPSALRALEPDRDEHATAFQVAYRCPSCGRLGCEEWHPGRLSLVPRAA